MKTSCEGFADQLVDYVDGELPPSEAQAVAQHVAGCESCRRTVAALEQSLTLAGVIWSDNLSGEESPARSAWVQRFRRLRPYAVAAGILIAATILMMTPFERRRQLSPIQLADMEWEIARAGAAAELLVATRIIAQCEGTEAIVERQYEFILQEYAGTPAAETIRAQHGSHLGGTQ